MLDKNPLTRATLDELKKDKWLNDGYAVSLDSKEADFFANYTEDELIDEGIPLTAIVNAVSALSPTPLIFHGLEKISEEVGKA